VARELCAVKTLEVPFGSGVVKTICLNDSDPFFFSSRARASGIPMLLQFAATLEEHQEGALAYYDYPISTGPLEGAKNKIQTMKRQAYGFRDLEFFKLKILALHQTKCALV